MRRRLIRGFERALGRALDTEHEAIARYVETGAAGCLPPGLSLLTWVVNSVHAYVFDTGNAAVIRGASLALKQLDQTIAQGRKAEPSALPIDPDQILFSGGGGGLAVVTSNQVGPAIRALHRSFTLGTLAATCSVASIPLDPDSTFRASRNQLYRQLVRQRTLAGSDSTAPLPFFVRRCRVCGQRAAAAATSRGAASPDRDECSLCRARIDRAKGPLAAGHEAQDFDAIRDRHGDLAVIYLDGNRIGDTISRLASPLASALFSTRLDECVRQLVDQQLDRYRLKPSSQEQAPRYQNPIQGGDDLVLIVPGWHGVPLARDLLHGFERVTEADSELATLDLTPLGAAAGVAMGRLPVRQLLLEAEALLESAKQRIYHDGVRSSLDFAVISDGQPRRSSRPAPRFDASIQAPLLLSAKPFDLDELDRFTRRRARIQEGPHRLATSQLHACRRVADDGPAQLRNHLLYQIGRHDAWRRLVVDLADSDTPLIDPDVAFETLVPRYGDARVFDLADMIELDDRWHEPSAPELSP